MAGWVPIGSPIEGAIMEQLVLQWGTHTQTGGSSAIGTTLQECRRVDAGRWVRLVQPRGAERKQVWQMGAIEDALARSSRMQVQQACLQ